MEILKKVSSKAESTGVDEFSGGRYLDAIGHLKDDKGKKLDGITIAVLRSIGSRMRFPLFDRGWYMSIEKLADDIGFKKTAIKNAIKKAVSLGFLRRVSRRFMGKKAPTYYELLPSAFASYKEKLGSQMSTEQPPSGHSGGVDNSELRPRGGQSLRPPHGHNAMAATRPKAPKSPKSENPKFSAPLSEARTIGELIFIPNDPGLPWVSRLAVHDVMQTALKRFGIEVLREFKAQRTAEDRLHGRTRFDARLVLSCLESIYNDKKKNHATLAADMALSYGFA